MNRGRLKLFFDGGCRPNPGPMEAAVVVRGVVHFRDDLGVGSSSDAEWLALIFALELLQSLEVTGAELIGDAVDVIAKANIALRSGTAENAHCAKVLALAATVRPGRIRWIKRQQNLAGIALTARHLARR